MESPRFATKTDGKQQIPADRKGRLRKWPQRTGRHPMARRTGDELLVCHTHILPRYVAHHMMICNSRPDGLSRTELDLESLHVGIIELEYLLLVSSYVGKGFISRGTFGSICSSVFVLFIYYIIMGGKTDLRSV